ncbi:MAG: hypothetical protein LC620_08885, partial [Halobacteriales archaeon]|nr:hypothetical protein [Halobacteriales archaeon]
RLEHVRPGMDDLVNAIKEKLEGRDAEAIKSLEEAKFHFSFVNYEGWICTASREVVHLQERLDSFWVSGDIDKARERLRFATRRIVEARQGPNHSPQAAALAKEAALAAKEGREAIHLVPPSEKLKVVFTVLKILGGFVGGIIAALVGFKALGWI